MLTTTRVRCGLAAHLRELAHPSWKADASGRARTNISAWAEYGDRVGRGSPHHSNHKTLTPHHAKSMQERGETTKLKVTSGAGPPLLRSRGSARPAGSGSVYPRVGPPDQQFRRSNDLKHLKYLITYKYDIKGTQLGVLHWTPRSTPYNSRLTVGLMPRCSLGYYLVRNTSAERATQRGNVHNLRTYSYSLRILTPRSQLVYCAHPRSRAVPTMWS